MHPPRFWAILRSRYAAFRLTQSQFPTEDRTLDYQYPSLVFDHGSLYIVRWQG